MPSNLFDLFDEKSKTLHDSVATDPTSLDDISDKEEEQVLFLEKVKSFEQVRSKADYSDFANFVFFNSAYDYFNITGEKILNEYPFDGTVGEIEQYTNALDDYQRYALSVWPRSAGHLRFNPANGFQYISVDDVGSEEGVSRSSLLSLGTSSFTLELWSVPPPALTGSNDIMLLVQKASSSSDGYSAFFSGSRLHFRVTSGSTTDEVSVASNPGENSYFSFVYDRNGAAPILAAYTGSQTHFPILANAITGTIVGSVVAGSSRFYMGSGSLSSKRTRPLTGSLDNVRVWSYPLPLSEMSSTFNAKIYSQKQLVALWRFNETGSVPNSTAQNSIVVDSSGHRLNGRIQNYSNSIRASGSLVSFEDPDLILNINTPEVQAHVLEQQTSGSAHDRNSDNIITRLVPQMFFQMEQNEAQVLENFLYVLARQFDETKVKINQFVKVLSANYTDFDQSPDALLADVGKFFGWEFTGNFLTSDASQYILGKNVLKNVESNKELEKKLFEIKNEFWRRVLINLMHLYKTKGTRESVESLLRVYGISSNIMKLKEYGYLPAAGIETNRITSEKTTFGMTFGSSSFSASNYVRSDHFYTNANSMEMRVRFPTTETAYVQPSTYTGWIFNTRSGTTGLDQFYYSKPSIESKTGTLFYQDRTGAATSLTGAVVFDGEWYNLSIVKNVSSGTITLKAVGYEEGEKTREYSSSVSASISTSPVPTVLWVGASGGVGSEMWANEMRFWDKPLTNRELDDHLVNFQSYGVDDVRNIDSLKLHWRLRENVTASAGGTITAPVHDYSSNRNFGTGFGFKPSDNPYQKFLQEYAYIASPDFGWNEDKIRIIDSTKIDPNDSFKDNRVLALEANMVDALNEDISQLMSSMEGLNNSLGLPVNRYRSEYADLARFRKKYFTKLQGRLNFRVFADMMEFFDRSFIGMVQKMLPHRAKFLGDEFVVESHMLERPKMQWNYRRRERELVIEGSIKVYQRT